eukprot:4595942-Amphidinium_carterae.5
MEPCAEGMRGHESSGLGGVLLTALVLKIISSRGAVIVDTEDATYQAGSSMFGARMWLSLCSEHYEPLLFYQRVAEVWLIHMLAEKPSLTGGGKAQLKGILAVAPALRNMLDARARCGAQD